MVYFSSLGGTTWGLDVDKGRVRWTFPDGRYTPVVTDGVRLYVSGRLIQYALEPTANAERRARNSDRRRPSGA